MKKSAALIPVIALLVAGGGYAWYDGVASKRAAPPAQAIAETVAEAKVVAAPAPAEQPKVNCILTLTSEQGIDTIGFTVAPAVENGVYNWTVSAGSISAGQGTSNILVSTKGVEGQPVTATVEALEHDAACPAGSNTVSLTAEPKAQ